MSYDAQENYQTPPVNKCPHTTRKRGPSKHTFTTQISMGKGLEGASLCKMASVQG